MNERVETKGCNMTKLRSILIVDNENDQLEMIKDMVACFGFSATTTDSSYEALKIVEKKSFSLILMDLIMNDIDGTELCEIIKEIRPKTRVYAMSGHLKLFRSDRLSRAGFDGILQKPFTMEELNAVLVGVV